jgi:hypothetical protein
MRGEIGQIKNKVTGENRVAEKRQKRENDEIR